MAKTGETQDRCTQYALDVVSGKITAGEYVRLACQRHLDDIEKSKAAPYKYYFDVEKSEEIINFAEELTIAEGEENEHVTAYPFPLKYPSCFSVTPRTRAMLRATEGFSQIQIVFMLLSFLI